MIAFHRPRTSSRRTACFALLAALALQACGGGGDGSTEPGSDGGGPIRVVAGGNQTDTAFAVLRQALVVEVRDASSHLAVGVTVRFTPINPGYGSRPTVLVSPIDQANFAFFASDATDPQGRAKTLLRFSTGAGTAMLEVSVPELGAVDTVSYTITPGKPVRLSIAPRDTTVPPGSTYALRVAMMDQWANPVAGATPTYSATGVTVSPAGQVSAGSVIGRARIIASFRDWADTVALSVVPQFRMVAFRGGAVTLVNSDGSGEKVLATSVHSSVSPTSVAATPSVVYYQGDPYYDSRLWVVEPNGVPRALLAPTARPEAWPRLSMDGTWVYFVRNIRTLWRVHLDGTGLDSLTSFDPPRIFSAPTVSPDGRTVAVEDRSGLKIVDVTSKATQTLNVSCPFPRYSPDGAFFACANPSFFLGTVSVVRSDGTGQRIVTQFDNFTGPDELSGVDWSADGKWIVALIQGRGTVLINVATGSVLQLTSLVGGMFQASFVR